MSAWPTTPRVREYYHPLDDALLRLLDELARFGADNDARETARPRRMLNITLDTGRLLWIERKQH